MIVMLAVVSAVLWRVFLSRADLQTEILALRHQIGVLQRQVPRPKLKPADRRFLGRSVPILVPIAFGALDRQTSHSHRVAPSWVPLVRDLEGSAWAAGLARTHSDSEP